MWRSAPQASVTSKAAETKNEGDHVFSEALKCKECGERTRSKPASCATSASARSRSSTTSRASTPRATAPHPGRPAEHLALRRLPAVRDAPKTALGAGLTPLVKADRLAEQLGPPRGLGQERRRQPDALVQGPRRHGRAGQGSGARLRGGRLRLDRQPGQRRRRPRRRRGPRLVRVHPVGPRGAEDPRHRRLRHQPGRRQGQLRRRQPALHRARRRARLGVREREREAVLRRGLEDARLRDRRAARLRAARPDRRAGRLRLAVHQDRARLRGVARGRPDRGRPAEVQRRPGRGLLARRPGVRGRQRLLQARHARRRSPSRSPSATRPTGRTRSTWPGAPTAASTRSPTTRSARASSCSPRPPASSPRPPAARRRPC